ncbi:alkaline phosphatase family protein [Halorhabdus sp. BNX81]|uniref:alkaline phosphatase family protein n=1 Tax=Halorhabdus sp. BNX81 TaxID=2980181 RepID=UPI0023DCF60A|nr:alkaline phosphatase family protein [Halorhabdus sp. BNX81]
MTRTVVIGLDGSNWPLVQPWIDAGRLPNFATLQSEGCHGISRSHLPPVTCPNWKCYASGKNPGRLGVYWWERIDTEDQAMQLPDATDFIAPEIWDYLNDENETAGVINLPMSYPPRDIDAFMIAGGPRSREQHYTIPETLEAEIEERFDYRVHPENVLTTNENADAEVEMVYDLLRTRLRTARTLLEERDLEFLHVTLFHLNVLQHYFWDAQETRRAYEIIDEELEPFLDGEYNLVLLSDHGCTDIDTVFYVNTWLAEHGYLSTKTSVSSRLHDAGLTQERIANIIRTVNLEKYIRPLVPRSIIERFPTDDGVVREAKLNMVDWGNTTAIGSGQGLIYVVADTDRERERILSDLEAELSAATALNGEAITRAVHRREDVYEGPHVETAPDLIFDQRPGVHTSEAMGRDEVMSEPTNWRGENVPDGMVLFHGEDIQAGELDPVRITDIAPTILHWMGHPVPTDMDGGVVDAVFTPDSDPGTRDVTHRPPLRTQDGASEALTDDVEDRLAQIGYLE